MRFRFSGLTNRKAVDCHSYSDGPTIEHPGLYTDRARSAIDIGPFRAYSALFAGQGGQRRTVQTDPFAVVAEAAPQFSEAQARDIARDHWGLDVAVRPLVSERDQNFRLVCQDGARYVLKIANVAERPEVTGFQVEALLHIADRVRAMRIPVSAPEVLPTTQGDTTVRLESAQGEHTVRVVTFLAGVPLGDRPASPRLARNMGEYLAHLGLALKGFDHPGSGQSLLWDIQEAPRLRDLLPFVAYPAAADAVAAALDDFERFALPVLASLRSQVVHSDMNPDNLLVATDDADAVAGIIDFGDMLLAPLVADVAIACSYLRVASGDPLRLIAEFVAAYHRIVPLTMAELDVLFDLIQTRLCASIAILDWRGATRRGDDPYLARRTTGEGSAHHFLESLRAVSREHARRVFGQACAPAG
jgi:Ser/Thr protein kinase RdoA (MazF antagonist)